MKFGSVCSGIEAASVAWNCLGWEADWFAEIEEFPSALLKHYYPNVPNLGDMTALPNKILNGEVSAPDILCGGTPCQAFSVAGNRQSLEDDRGNLTLTFCEIADAIDTVRINNGQQPAIIFWENVPGVLNTKDNAFGCFLGKLAGEDGELVPAGKKWTNTGCVFGSKRTVAWRVLDAQYFGVAQRRRRVFVVASARDEFSPAEVLFEFEGLRRDIAPSRKARERTSADAQTGTRAFNKQRIGEYSAEDIASTCAARDYKDATDLVTMGEVAGPLDASYYKGQGSRQGGEREFVAQPKAFAQNQFGEVREGDVFNTLTINSNASGRNTPMVMAHAFKVRCGCEGGGKGYLGQDEQVFTPSTSQDQHVFTQVAQTVRSNPYNNSDPSMEATMHIVQNHIVRRLTPTECERLQGFPDGYTNIEYKGKPAPDTQRYKALGNSWAVPVVRWIGNRIKNEVSK